MLLLDGSDACFAPVLHYGEVHRHPHNASRESYVEVDGQWHPQPAPRFSVTAPEPAWADATQSGARPVLEALGIEADLLDAARVGT